MRCAIFLSLNATISLNGLTASQLTYYWIDIDTLLSSLLIRRLLTYILLLIYRSKISFNQMVSAFLFYSGTNAEFTKADTVIFRTDLYNMTTGERKHLFKRTLKYDSKWLESMCKI